MIDRTADHLQDVVVGKRIEDVLGLTTPVDKFCCIESPQAGGNGGYLLVF